MTVVGGMTLVYQSGHTNTWCDGDRHIRNSGGYAKILGDGMSESDIAAAAFAGAGRVYKCDCAKWAAFNARFGNG